LYTPWLLVYDSYNDKQIYIPPSGHVAAQYAYNDYVDEPWFAPAGFKRGLLNVLSINYIFDEPGGELDTLYNAQINPIQLFRNEGTVIWGQKTLQAKTSALSSVNVRRLFIILEKTIAAYLRQFVEEPNDEVTRFRIKSRLEEYMDSLSAKRAFQTSANDKGYYVLCDENNNKPKTIEDLQLNVDLFVKPIRAAEFIQLQVISTPTSVKIEELVASGAMY
jgi:phage tail sheath protein FI